MLRASLYAPRVMSTARRSLSQERPDDMLSPSLDLSLALMITLLSAVSLLSARGALFAQGMGSQPTLNAQMRGQQAGREAGQQAPLRLCTGSANNHYFQIGRMIARALAQDTQVDVIVTKGSWENLGRAHAQPPQCDALIAQEDAYAIYLDEHPQQAGVIERVTALYQEHVHLICHRKMKAARIEDLPDSTRVLIGPYGSGTYITWTLMKSLNPKMYRRLRDFEAIGDEALLKVVDGAQAQCMLSVNALAQGVVAKAHDDYGDRLSLVSIDDPLINRALRQPDGELRPLYRPTYVHKNVYPQLLDERHLKTNVVDAVFFIQSGWRRANPQLSERLLKVLAELQPLIIRSVD
jgi:TRAP-type uncharacterized transport system substrate-binding protein